MAEKEINSAIAHSKLKSAKDKARKKNFFRGVIGGVVLLLGYGIYILFAPINGTMAFGICKTFLELNVRYPGTLNLSTVEDFATSVRIWYVDIDSFGEYRMEPIQCFYKPDPSGSVPYLLEKIVINRREVDPKQVEAFNRIVPILFASPPDLALPWELPDSLADLKVDTDRFRKPILNKSY